MQDVIPCATKKPSFSLPRTYISWAAPLKAAVCFDYHRLLRFVNRYLSGCYPAAQQMVNTAASLYFPPPFHYVPPLQLQILIIFLCSFSHFLKKEYQRRVKSKRKTASARGEGMKYPKEPHQHTMPPMSGTAPLYKIRHGIERIDKDNFSPSLKILDLH